MTQSMKPSYCWVRLVKAGPDVHDAAHPDGHEWPEGCASEIGPRIEGKKPKGRMVGPVVKGEAFQVFGADERLFGRDGADTFFDLGPAFKDEDDARKWITEPAGLAWDAEALNRFLLRFDPAVMATPMQDKKYPNGPGKFPREDWSADHACLDIDNLEPSARLFQVSDIPLPDLHAFVQLAGGPDEERRILLELQRERKSGAPKSIDPIFSEGTGRLQAATPVFRVLGFDTDAPTNLKLKAWRERIVDNLEAPLYQCKKKWNRERPWTVWPGQIEPLFYDADPARRHSSYPGHPAFPGGHALVATTFALLLAERFPSRKADLLAAADAVARRRESAGLHFRSDSLAGAAMANDVVRAIKASSHWKELLAFLNTLEDLSVV